MAVVPFDGQNVQFERAKAPGPRSAFDTTGSLPLTQHMRDQLGASSDTKFGIHS